jgi:hypothetical protein
VADELFDTLLRFHREVVQPELNEIRGEVQAIRGEMATRAELQAVRDAMATREELQAGLQAVRAEMQAMRAEMVTWPVLMRYHEEIVKPEMENLRSEIVTMTRSEMLSHVDGIYVGLGRLEIEYQAFRAAVGRLEKQMAEQIADRMEVRAELLGLTDKVSQLTVSISELGREMN